MSIARPNRARALELMYARVAIIGEIDDRNEATIRSAIERASDEPEIFLHIDSNGGSLLCAERIARDLKDTCRRVIARVGSDCSSAAVVPFSIADRRISQPDSRFVLHAPWTGVEGKFTASSLGRLANDLEWHTRSYRTHLATWGLPDHLIAVATGHDGLVLSGREALALGLVDELQ